MLFSSFCRFANNFAFRGLKLIIQSISICIVYGKTNFSESLDYIINLKLHAVLFLFLVTIYSFYILTV